MKNIFKIVRLTSMCLLMFMASSCMSNNVKILDLNDVQNLKVSVNEASTELRISGLAFHSALAVEKIMVSEVGSDLVIEVYLVRARSGLSGSFSKTIYLKPETSRVLFGVERREIWTR